MNTNDFITADAELLQNIESDIYEQLAPLIDSTVARMGALPDDASDDNMESVLAPLNDGLSSAIGSVMFIRQQDVAAMALNFAPGQMPPMRSPAQLMEAARISGESIASNFKRRSPSKWMQNLIGQTRKQIEAQVDAAIASGVWAIAGNIQQFTWDAPPKWRWITKTDELVCDVCRPLNNVVFDEPKGKAHWACRCECLPAPAQSG
ncbi:phage head morphogenesis protein [Synechococcus sp. AH-601-B19]|nr:phage head morphogenesis protein [Synechococcus sp. AH-601-B19]